MSAVDLFAWLLSKRYVLNTGFIINDVLATIGATRAELDAAVARLDVGVGLKMPVFTQHFSHGIEMPSTPRTHLHPVPDLEGETLPEHRAAIPDAPTVPAEQAEPAPDKPKPKGKQKPSRVRPTGVGPLGESTMQCTGPCGEWLPLDSFTPRSDRPGLFAARCKECRRRYMAARHVKTATLDALGALGVKFQLDAESNIVGLACTNCGEPFRPGDNIHGTVNDLAHDECPDKG